MTRFKYIQTTTLPSGEIVRYLRKPGEPKIRLREKWDTPAFEFEYNKAISGQIAPVPPKGGDKRRVAPEQSQPDTLRWLVTRYYGSADYKTMKLKGAGQRRYYLDTACAIEDIGTGRKLGDMSFNDLGREHVRMMHALYIEQPTSASQRVEAIRILFNWAATAFPKMRIANPVPKGWKRIVKGYYIWTAEDRETYRKRWPIGTSQRLWFELQFRLGVRISDVGRIGPQFENKTRDALSFTETKGGDSKSVSDYAPEPKHHEAMSIPKELRKIIDATTPTGLKTYLISDSGKPYGERHLSRRVRQWCNAAGLKRCTAHGVRKSGATFLAKSGASEREIMAYGNWSNSAGVKPYVDANVATALRANVDARLARA